MDQMKKIITCDIDGVLTDYPICWLKYLEEQCGTYYNTVEEAKQYERNYSLYKDKYRKSVYKATLPINKRNKIGLNKLAERYDIVFTTSRPINNIKYPELFDNTYNWLLNNGLVFKQLCYKDENGNFLDGLDIIFHIDDEIKYANIIANKFRNVSGKDNGKVYLLTKDSMHEGLDEDVIIARDIQEIADRPFFSVCIPATNREKTVYRALKSVADQSYRNFEVVICDCLSKDNTVLEINRFFDSNDFRNHKFDYIFEKKDYVPRGTEDWNEPIKLAKGKYIAMLEGDDYWLPEHLMNAYLVLSNNHNIGIYGASNLKSKRHFQGLLSNKKAREYCYNMKDGVVPPSESAFIRCNKSQEPFLYNSIDYNYSPEIALYLDIILRGYDLYYSQIQDVYREPSSDPQKMSTWYYYADRFYMLEKYKGYFSKIVVFKSQLYNALYVVNTAFFTKSINKCSALLKNLIESIGWPIVLLCLVLLLFKVLIKVLFFLPRRLIRLILKHYG